MAKRKEGLLAQRVANHIRRNYPQVMFRFDLGADMPLPPHLARKSKDLHGDMLSRGHTALVFYEPRGKYHGLFIELKEDSSVSKYQKIYMERLRKRGYQVKVGRRYEPTIEIIDAYLNI